MRFDWTGLALFFPAVVAVFTAISFGNSKGWTSPTILGLFGVGVALAIGFVRREGRCGEPMLDLALFRRSRFSAGIASGMLSYLVMFGVLFLVPFYLERGLQFGSGRSGLELMMMPLALGITAPLAGRLADRLGARPLTIAGMATVAGALAVLGALRPSTPVFLVLLAVVGIGLGLFTPPNNAAIMGSVPQAQSGLASGVLNMTRGMGTALGLALTGLVFDISGGRSSASSSVAHAFTVTALFLAVLAVVAGIIASLRRWPIGAVDRRPCGVRNEHGRYVPEVTIDDDAGLHQRLLTRGRRLEGTTLGWNVVGIIVLAFAAIGARSVALAGFGLDSLIEVGASTVVLWGVGRRRTGTSASGHEADRDRLYGSLRVPRSAEHGGDCGINGEALDSRRDAGSQTPRIPTSLSGLTRGEGPILPGWEHRKATRQRAGCVRASGVSGAGSIRWNSSQEQGLSWDEIDKALIERDQKHRSLFDWRGTPWRSTGILRSRRFHPAAVAPSTR